MTGQVDGVVAPSAEMAAVVRHSDPPELVPDELLPYVVPHYVDDRLDDWTLSDDAVAFGEVDVPRAYQRWRATWERAWPLDPQSNLSCLTAVARELATDRDVPCDDLTDLVEAAESGERVIEGSERLLALADAVEWLRDAIRARGATGFGFVDVTEGRGRVGLARAWSPAAGDEVLAADRHLVVSMRVGRGLHVELAGPPPSSIAAVEEVAVRSSSVEVTGADGVVQLPLSDSAALTWIVPGAARWRVRRVPEVLVWARTLGGLPECCRYASTLRRAVIIRAARDAPVDQV